MGSLVGVSRWQEVAEGLQERLYRHSVEDNWKWLRRRFRGGGLPPNALRPVLWEDAEALGDYLREKVKVLGDQVAVVGGGEEAALLAAALRQAAKGYRELPAKPDLDQAGRVFLSGEDICLAPWPAEPSDWEYVCALRERVSNRVFTFQEMVLPLGLILAARERLRYRFEDLREVMAYYTGKKRMGPMAELAERCPLGGKRVIEFGPFDGYQTAALLACGAAHVTAVEARPENALKTLAAKASFGWRNVEVVVDDFHNVSRANYGIFDLAFAHGVYYHSMAPFVFFENLCSLSERVFLGGYIATEKEPAGDFRVLDYGGSPYRVKEYRDGLGLDQGVNWRGYYFDARDLERFFERKGYRIVPLSGQEQFQATGRYHRFLAVKGA